MTKRLKLCPIPWNIKKRLTYEWDKRIEEYISFNIINKYVNSISEGKKK